MATKEIVVIGRGGHARVVAALIRDGGQFHATGFIEWNPDSPDEIEKAIHEGKKLFALTLGDNRKRSELYQRVTHRGGIIPALVHPTAIVDKSAVIEPGAQICAGALVCAEALIGANTIINSGAVIEHECHIGEHCHVGPGAVLVGRVTVDAETFIGAGATVTDDVHIGGGVIIGAGSVVIRDVPAFVTAVGVPAKVIKERS